MVSCLGGVLAAWGKAQQARDILRELDEAGRHRYVSKVFVAAIYASLGDTDQALSNLEQAREDRCCWRTWCLPLDARLDCLRDHPRFQALMRIPASKR
jgi:hypothetical protein